MDEFLKEWGSILMRVFYILLVALVSKILVPWLKEKKVYDTICRFVRAAEKLADAGKIDKAKKKLYVRTLLEKKGVKITPEVDAMIEAAVEDLDLLKNEFLLGLPAAREDGGEDDDVEPPEGTEKETEGEIL